MKRNTTKKPAGPRIDRRSAGVLLHVTSLPSKYGIGDLGPAAHRWVEWLAKAKQTWWQVLPLNPPDDSDSPYSALSAYAGNPYLVSPDLLIRDGFVRRRDVPADPGFPADRVAFDLVKPFKAKLLDVAWERFRDDAASPWRKAFDDFCAAEAGWLDDFALYVALREQQPGMSWTEWPAPLVRRKPAALAEAREAAADSVDRHRFAQFLFHRQLAELRAHAATLGVGLIGDLPIYVSGESADVWANPHLFQLDSRRRPRNVAGVPPDIFAVTGQRWGVPVFDWKAMRAEKYAWWVARMKACLRHADVIRIDHFRGLAGYYSIPGHHPTAEHGRWVKGPGAELFEAFQAAFGGVPVIAEDLGLITPDVVELRLQFDLPGMQILQYAFGDDDNASLPHHHPRNTVAYPGTHDNETTVGWFGNLPPKDRGRLKRYAPGAESDPAGTLVRLAWASVANLALAQMQDLLQLGPAARMNTPGVAAGNWGWRATEADLSKKLAIELADLTMTYGRGK